MVKDQKQRVFETLKKDPKGMTIQEISRKTKMNRVSAAIYVHELLGEGKVHLRKVGAYKLFKVK